MFSVAPILTSTVPLAERLEKLKAIPGVLQLPPPSREALPWDAAQTALPRGALTEISGPAGSGKTEAVLKFLAQNQQSLGRIAWIEDQFSAFPTGFSQHGIDLSRVLFIEGGNDSLWAAHQVLRSQVFGAVILFARERTLSTSEPRVELRRLQLSAEQSHAAVILLTHQPRPPGVNWPIALQIRANPQGRRLDVLKRAG